MKKKNKKPTLTEMKREKRANRAKVKVKKLNILREHRKHERKLERARREVNVQNG